MHWSRIEMKHCWQQKGWATKKTLPLLDVSAYLRQENPIFFDHAVWIFPCKFQYWNSTWTDSVLCLLFSSTSLHPWNAVQPFFCTWAHTAKHQVFEIKQITSLLHFKGTITSLLQFLFVVMHHGINSSKVSTASWLLSFSPSISSASFCESNLFHFNFQCQMNTANSA